MTEPDDAPTAPSDGTPRPAARAAARLLRVDTRVSTLRLRSAPTIGRVPTANVLAELPDGHRVRAMSSAPEEGFVHVETWLGGTRFEGWAAARHLVDDDGATPIDPGTTATPAPAVWMPRHAGVRTRRTQPATAHSLDEPDPPARTGATPAARCAELLAIVDWLGVDDPAHRRWWPHDGFTYCNVYAHDVCHLAGAYLPRVWWTPPALVALARGDAVPPLIGDTIVEMRANDLFRWLGDHGGGHGWRRATDATALQDDVNDGALGLIVARRRHDGRSGHLVPVLPESAERPARRDRAGRVTAPLQSQAGRTNFRIGTGTPGWWRDAKFAEFAFWRHD